MTDDATEPQAYTLAEAADRLGISRDALRKRCDRGLVPGAYKLDGRWLIPAVSLTGLTDRPTGRDSADRRPVSHAPDMTGQAVQAAIEALVAQLAEKDRQIATLLAELERRPTGQPALPPASTPAPEAPAQRPAWWRRWLGR